MAILSATIGFPTQSSSESDYVSKGGNIYISHLLFD